MDEDGSWDAVEIQHDVLSTNQMTSNKSSLPADSTSSCCINLPGGGGTVSHLLIGGQKVAFTQPQADKLVAHLDGAAFVGPARIIAIMENGGFHLNFGTFEFTGQVCPKVPENGWTVPAQTQATITINGVYFDSGTTVEFDGTPAESVSFIDSETLEVTTPALAAGDYDMIIQTSSNGSAMVVSGPDRAGFTVE